MSATQNHTTKKTRNPTKKNKKTTDQHTTHRQTNTELQCLGLASEARREAAARSGVQARPGHRSTQKTEAGRPTGRPSNRVKQEQQHSYFLLAVEPREK